MPEANKIGPMGACGALNAHKITHTVFMVRSTRRVARNASVSAQNIKRQCLKRSISALSRRPADAEFPHSFGDTMPSEGSFSDLAAEGPKDRRWR
ncbi:hypothetical protein CHELA20_51076 [Hyphomicrobiales bacterium]|nr:hypothetical protein CHELA20_51076 [Hyphomicrobiales bacterium]CAH1674220.1 hypothetical protein CHELA41_23934 [Hyphomicrobiales bacterium]